MKKFSFFKLRSNSKNAKLNLNGFWSYPILTKSKTNHILWMYLISKTVASNSSNKTLILRPSLMLLTLPNSDNVVHYQNFYFGHDPFPKISRDKPIGYFPHGSIRDLTVIEFEECENKLISLLEIDSTHFQSSNNITDELKILYAKLSNPIFKEFISCLSPDFYKLIWA